MEKRLARSGLARAFGLMLPLKRTPGVHLVYGASGSVTMSIIQECIDSQKQGQTYVLLPTDRGSRWSSAATGIPIIDPADKKRESES